MIYDTIESAHRRSPGDFITVRDKQMKSYDLYGIKKLNLQTARSIIERALGISFQTHESSWRGGEYFRCGAKGEESFVLQLNMCDDDEPAEIDFPQYLILLYIEDTIRSDEIQALITNQGEEFELTRHEEL